MGLISRSTQARASRSRESCWRIYIVECADGTLYTGISTDVQARVQKHNDGDGARYTAKRRPVRLVATSAQTYTQGEALRREYAVKQLHSKLKVQQVQEW